MGKEITCEYCGKTVSKPCNGHEYKYCSRKCFVNGRWGEPIQFGKIKTRSKKFLAAISLCQSGMTGTEAARQLGVHPRTVSDWFVDNGIVFSDRACLHCGKPFTQTKNVTNRKYCSKSCSCKASYARKHPEGRQRRFDPELRTRALEMYWGGLEGRIISEHLELPEGTLHSWIHDFGYLRKRRRDSEIMKLLPVNLQIESAKSPKEWKQILREYAPEGDTSPVIIVCRPSNGNGATNNFATTVFDLLKRNPCDGATYAFCSSSGEQVSTICWQRGSFCLTKMPKAKGGYIWPSESVGTQIEVWKNEFEYLLSLSKKRGAKPYIT
jgi:transposase